MLVAAVVALSLLWASDGRTQQVADLSGDLSVAAPRWRVGEGPRVAIDEGHHNFHTVDGRYAPFATLLRNDGAQVSAHKGTFTQASLQGVDILVISNALAQTSVDNWTAPTPSAFTEDEIASIAAWVEAGGALLLIADHMPFAGAAQALARRFGFEFENSFALIEGPERFALDNRRLERTSVTADVTSVRSFTGSSFQAPSSAEVVLRLDGQFEIVTPAIAWEFADQPRRVATWDDLRLATLQVGQGRLVVSGEAAMFTAQTAGDTKMGLNAEGAGENKRLLLNIISWLAGHSGSSREP